MVVLAVIPAHIAQRVYFRIEESELDPANAGSEKTIPIGNVRSGGRLIPAAVHGVFVLNRDGNACRFEIMGKVEVAPG